MSTLVARDVQTLFNRKAHSWRSKYRADGKLHSRIERFRARLEELVPRPAKILDLGCGTGDITAVLDARGFQMTGCDFAEEMIAVARRSHPQAPVEWVCLEPDWTELPFAAGRFDGIIASSVFEYLGNVPSVAAELSRVLRPEGLLLLTVPNPFNRVRKLEAGARSLAVRHHLPPWLERIPRLHRYLAYLRLSRNRWEGAGWQSVLGAAQFAAVDQRDFSRDAWRGQAHERLVMLAVKKQREISP